MKRLVLTHWFTVYTQTPKQEHGGVRHGRERMPRSAHWNRRWRISAKHNRIFMLEVSMFLYISCMSFCWYMSGSLSWRTFLTTSKTQDPDSECHSSWFPACERENIQLFWVSMFSHTEIRLLTITLPPQMYPLHPSVALACAALGAGDRPCKIPTVTILTNDILLCFVLFFYQYKSLPSVTLCIFCVCPGISFLYKVVCVLTWVCGSVQLNWTGSNKWTSLFQPQNTSSTWKQNYRCFEDESRILLMYLFYCIFFNI